MARVRPVLPADPHDLRLGMRKVFGWEIVAPILCVVASLAGDLVLRRLPPEVHFGYGEVLVLISLSIVASFLANWRRELEARRGVRASWVNVLDAASILLLVAGAARAAFADDVVTPWYCVVVGAMLASSLIRLHLRRRRARAPTPSQRAEAAFE